LGGIKGKNNKASRGERKKKVSNTPEETQRWEKKGGGNLKRESDEEDPAFGAPLGRD